MLLHEQHSIKSKNKLAKIKKQIQSNLRIIVGAHIEISLYGKLRYMKYYSTKTHELERGIAKGRKSHTISKITQYRDSTVQ